jgi:copper chaperone NosL
MNALALALGLLGLASLACEDANAPVDPVWGKQACASCAMLVSDPRFAAQLATEDGSRVFFDDAGCMATWLREHGGRARRLWVRNGAATWVDARTARFASGEKSPMNYGFAPAEGGDQQWADVEAAARARGGEGR